MNLRRRNHLMAFFLFAGLMFLVLLIGRSVIAQDWRNTSHEPVGLAPDPAATPEAVVQVYAARTWGLRGLFGVHTWVAVKPAGAKAYTVYELIGWHLRWAESAVMIHRRDPDARWFGNEPEASPKNAAPKPAS